MIERIRKVALSQLLRQRDALDRMSAIGLALAVLVATQFAITTMFAALPLERRLSAVVVVAALIASWIVGHRRRHFPLLGVPLEMLAIVFLGVVAPEPNKVVPVAFLSLLFRALHGTGGDALVLSIGYAAALPTMAALQPNARFTINDALGLISVLVINALLSRAFRFLLLSRDEMNRRLRHQADHDQLTNLRNRGALRDELNAAIPGLRERGGFAAIVFIDLDDFKVVNDTYGHAVGDQLLTLVAKRFEAALPRADALVARLGGDEFAVLLPRLDLPEAATVIATRILRTLEEPFEIGDREIFMRASVGVAICGSDWQHDGGELLRRADVAMYAAKAKGKGRVETYSASMTMSADRQMRLTTDLRHALARKELTLEFQPVVRLVDRHVVGSEALLHWDHPEYGPIPPLELVTLADQIGLSLPIGRFTVEESIRTLSGWRRHHPTLDADFKMAVNLSSPQLLASEMIAFIAATLERFAVPSTALVVEITETILMRDTTEIRQRVEELKRVGVGVALDEFGTGYSSISYLRDFPIDILKLDRSFLSGITEDQRNIALIQSMVDMSQRLRIRSLSEGIETDALCDLLNRYGCELGQGRLFGQPAAAKPFELRYLAQDPSGFAANN